MREQAVPMPGQEHHGEPRPLAAWGHEGDHAPRLSPSLPGGTRAAEAALTLRAGGAVPAPNHVGNQSHVFEELLQVGAGASVSNSTMASSSLERFSTRDSGLNVLECAQSRQAPGSPRTASRQVGGGPGAWATVPGRP